MTDYQRNEHVADIGGDPDQSGIEVHVARWPNYPGGRDHKVMWRHSGTYNYLPPSLARRFAAALVEAADRAEQESG